LIINSPSKLNISLLQTPVKNYYQLSDQEIALLGQGWKFLNTLGLAGESTNESKYIFFYLPSNILSPVALLEIWDRPKYTWIKLAYVDPSFRGRSIGEYIIKYVQEPNSGIREYLHPEMIGLGTRRSNKQMMNLMMKLNFTLSEYSKTDRVDWFYRYPTT
jgi:GNAT superfamily N-acetyltransferase